MSGIDGLGKRPILQTVIAFNPLKNRAYLFGFATAIIAGLAIALYYRHTTLKNRNIVTEKNRDIVPNQSTVVITESFFQDPEKYLEKRIGVIVSVFSESGTLIGMDCDGGIFKDLKKIEKDGKETYELILDLCPPNPQNLKFEKTISIPNQQSVKITTRVI